MSDHVLTATQCRMARAALRWELSDLAERAGVSANTIYDFENGRDMPIPAKLVALRQAFEANFKANRVGGVVGFTKDGGFGWQDRCESCRDHKLLTIMQCKIARAALGWSMKDLAKQASRVLKSAEKTIDGFENNQSMPRLATQKALLEIFKAHGVRFTEEEPASMDSVIATFWIAMVTDADEDGKPLTKGGVGVREKRAAE